MKVLCVRLTALGDMVVTTPVYRALAKQLQAEVHVLTRPGTAQMLTGNPYIAEIVNYEREDLLDYLRAQRYDLLVDLHCNARSHKLRLALGLPVVGYHKRNIEKALLSHGINRFGDQHLVHRYFEALRPLGITYDGEGLDYFVAQVEASAAELAIVEKFAKAEPSERGYIALVIAGTHFTKRMPLELLERLVQRTMRPLVLLGGPDVEHLAEQLLDRVGEGRVINLVAQLPLRVSCAVLAKAVSVIATDTGLMHVAAALRKPTVSVWGSTAPPYGMFPFMPKAAASLVKHAEVKGLSCHPCSKIGYAECPQGHFKCMHLQDAGEITSDAEELAQTGLEMSVTAARPIVE